MGEHTIHLKSQLNVLRQIDPRLMSYNVEMTEVTGGTFWKAYTPAQIAGTEPFPPIKSMAELSNLMQVYPPIDLANEKLRRLTRELGPAWVRVSGTWATKTYYDFDGHTGGKAPEGYQNLLTKEQWTGLLDFVKAVGAKLMVSVANCEGLHKADEPWNPSQAKILFDYSRDYGVPIDAAEFMNEPNMLAASGAPAGYTAKDYARDQDLFFAWVRKNYPGTLLVGPCTTGGDPDSKDSGGIATILESCSTDALMQGTQQPLDVFTYHYYNGISDRLASVMPQMHWSPDKTLSEEYLAVAPSSAAAQCPARNKHCPGGAMWVTESGDAGGGGNTWASTYTDVFRTLNELGGFATVTDGIIFHNTLASSDYGFLAHGSFDPRPNYFAALLWNKLMGQTVFDAAEPIREGAHVYAHSRKDGKEGIAYLILNNSKTSTTTVELPKSAERYTLTAADLRSTTMLLNDQPLVLQEDGSLPELNGISTPAGTLELAPASCTFLLL